MLSVLTEAFEKFNIQCRILITETVRSGTIVS